MAEDDKKKKLAKAMKDLRGVQKKAKNELTIEKINLMRKRAEQKRFDRNPDLDRTKAVSAARKAFKKKGEEEIRQRKLRNMFKDMGFDYADVEERMEKLFSKFKDQISDEMVIKDKGITQKEFDDYSVLKQDLAKSRLAKEIAKNNEEYVFLDRTRKDLNNIRMDMMRERDSIEEFHSSNRGAYMQGDEVDEKFAKWKKPYSGEDVKERFYKEAELADKGIAPKTNMVETSKRQFLVSDAVDKQPRFFHPEIDVSKDMDESKAVVASRTRNETTLKPFDLHEDNIGHDRLTGDPQVIDAGKFEKRSGIDSRGNYKKDILEARANAKMKAKDLIINKKTAGTIRRKLPSLIGPAIGLGAYLMADDAKAKTEILEDMADPASILGGAERLGGDLPANELVKRNNFNRAIQLRQINEVRENESRNQSTTTNPF